MIYLDHAATTPLRRLWRIPCTMCCAISSAIPPPSILWGREAKELVEEARRTIAGALGCQPSALHFTSCGTESDNWAIRAAAWQGPPHGAAHHHHCCGAQRRAGALPPAGTGGV